MGLGSDSVWDVCYIRLNDDTEVKDICNWVYGVILEVRGMFMITIFPLQ